MYKFAVIILCAGISATASAAPLPAGGKFSSLNWVNTNYSRNPFGAVSVKPIPPAVQPNRLSANTNTMEEWGFPIVPKPAAVTPKATWVSLNTWAARHGLRKPRLLSKLPVTTYSLRSSNGVMELTIGSREATWNGVEIHLGFEPQIIDGRVYMHGLDVRKNLKPLLCDPPLALPQTNGIIVIDPGHGGSNTGTHSVLDGRFEKEFTLDWAKQLAPLLTREGWRVYLTRTKDVTDSLSNRVAFANAHHADLFMSLHFNSTAPNEKPEGIETYCLTPTGLPSTLTRGYADPLTASYPDNAYDAQNLQLAVRLEGALVHATGMDDRGVCRARFITVLQGQHCPAVLIEAGFLSNPGDARRIETRAFREKLAKAVAKALRPKAKTQSQPAETGITKAGTNKLSWP